MQVSAKDDIADENVGKSKHIFMAGAPKLLRKLLRVLAICLLAQAAFIPVLTALAQRGDKMLTPIEGNSFAIRNVRVFNGTSTLEGVNVVVKDGRIIPLGRGRIPGDLLKSYISGRSLIT